MESKNTTAIAMTGIIVLGVIGCIAMLALKDPSTLIYSSIVGAIAAITSGAIGLRIGRNGHGNGERK